MRELPAPAGRGMSDKEFSEVIEILELNIIAHALFLNRTHMYSSTWSIAVQQLYYKKTISDECFRKVQRIEDATIKGVRFK